MKRKKAAATAANPGAAVATAIESASREPDYHWGGQPVFKCHVKQGCQFERLNNLEAVLDHERLHEEGRPPERESRILGKDGKPLKVEGDHENE
jgi:hypothetical protein